MNTCYSFLYDVLVLESVVVGVAFSVNIVIPVLVHIYSDIYLLADSTLFTIPAFNLFISHINICTHAFTLITTKHSDAA